LPFSDPGRWDRTRFAKIRKDLMMLMIRLCKFIKSKTVD